jgi:beta-1,2-mannobiose phosphorylase / 1,2-beta-oligomannan phosphorylase
MHASVTKERTKEGRTVLTMTMSPRTLHRLGIVMEPQSDDAREAGVLNPAVARGPDGQLYLLPRLVATGNYSRIGLARIRFDRRGDPVGVERLGVVLEPQAPYERNTRTGGGVEDPRVTYLAARGLYVMTYTAFGEAGPRIAVAVSRDLVRWHRTGLVRFAPLGGLDLEAQDNKDALLFPEPLLAPDGRLALALIHRPTFRLAPAVSAGALLGLPSRPSMWLSYAPLDEIAAGRSAVFGQHHLLAGPWQDWEHLKVGGGAPPLRVRDGWLVLYHGVAGRIVEGIEQEVCYSAGVLLLDGQDPRRILYRSARSILAPQVAAERLGVVPRVVFPTGLDVRADGTLDIYYGMADSRIGVARACAGELLGSVAPAA